MKKILLVLLSAVITLSLTGCFGNRPSYENVETAQGGNTEIISQKDYTDNLDGLIKYFQALNYLPKQTESTKMLSEVIGAKSGFRYIYNVDGSTVIAEFYEFEPNSTDANTKRVIGEIKEKGSFHLFDKEGVDKDTTYPAVLSDNEKYMMIYTDNSSNEGNIVRKKQMESVLKSFYSNKPVQESSNTEESSKTEENSKAQESSKAEESSKAA